MTVKRYAERDAMDLDKAGDYYCRHVMAMTSEGLHNKGDIAAELGFRDMQIDALQAQVKALAEECAALKEAFSGVMKHVFRIKTYLDNHRVLDSLQGLRWLIERRAGLTPATDATLRNGEQGGDHE